MSEFFLKYGGEIITAVVSLVTAIIARRKEKAILRSKGLLIDKK